MYRHLLSPIKGGNFTLLRFAIVDTLYEAASVPGRTAMIYNDKSAQGLRGVLGFEIAHPLNGFFKFVWAQDRAVYPLPAPPLPLQL